METYTERKLRDEWMTLNIKISSIFKTLKMNTAAGYKASDEYMEWLNGLISRRDYLTTIVK